jgi:hypothetical protein
MNKTPTKPIQVCSDEVPTLLPEILVLISKCVWSESMSVQQLLSWHSTCTYFWNEYLNIEGEKFLEFTTEKRKKNQALLHNKLLFEYKNNMIEFAQFESIILICIRFREKILTINTELLENEQVIGKTMVFPISNWTKWKGIKFEENDVLNKHSLHILNAASALLGCRYGWGLMFLDSTYDPVQKWVNYPWNEPIKNNFECYLGQGTVGT